MRHASELVPVPGTALPAAEPVRAAELAPEVKRATELLINRLFSELRAIYPAWKQAWSSEDLYRRAKASWTQALLDSGIADWGLVERGLRQCRAEPGDFIPSAGKFIERCWPTPAELGAPAPVDAYWEAQRNCHPAMVGYEHWSHRAVFHAAIRCSRHSLLTLPAEVGRAKFEKHYGEVIRALALGADLPEPAPALPAEVMRKSDPAKGREAIAALRAAVAGGARA